MLALILAGLFASTAVFVVGGGCEPAQSGRADVHHVVIGPNDEHQFDRPENDSGSAARESE